MTPSQPRQSERSDNVLPYELDGDFVVAVGHAVGTVIDPQEAVSVSDDADIAFRVTVVAPNLYSTVETVDLSSDDVLATVRAMYMMQRASCGEERDSLPDTYSDPYAVIVYIGDLLRGWDDRVEEHESSERYTTEPPAWVATRDEVAER